MLSRKLLDRCKEAEARESQPYIGTGRTICVTFCCVKKTNCLIKEVGEMGIVASNKKVLEINETYPSCGRSHKEVGMRLTMQQRQAVVAKALSSAGDHHRKATQL
jgi:hypothetical protein